MIARSVSTVLVTLLANVILLPLCVAQKPKPPTCTQFVHYDKKNLSITLPNFHSVTLGSVKLQSDKIQAAATLTQLFDLVQFSNCQILNRLAQQSDAEEYSEASRTMLDANTKLLALAIQFDEYNKDDSQASSVAQTATKSLTTAKTVQASTTSLASAKNIQVPTSSTAGKKGQGTSGKKGQGTLALEEIKAVDLDKIASDLHGELSEELARLVKVQLPRDELWSLITEDRKESIRKQLKIALDMLRSNGFLHLDEKDLAAFILMPGGDGQLYFPPGLFIRPIAEPQNVPSYSIPLGYGASGLAFAENKSEFVDVSDTMLKIGSSDEAQASQRKIRMILLPEKAMNQVRARYIAAFPIDNTQGQPIAVMSISVYKILPQADDLREVCNNLQIGNIAIQIAQQLTLSK